MKQREARKHVLAIMSRAARRYAEEVFDRDDLSPADQIRMSQGFTEEADRYDRLRMGAKAWNRRKHQQLNDPDHPDDAVLYDVRTRQIRFGVLGLKTLTVDNAVEGLDR